jgi:hypothetical protein
VGGRHDWVVMNWVVKTGFCVWVYMPDRLQCTPDLNTYRVYVQSRLPHEPRPGEYRGFCLRGKPDGPGEWIGDRRRLDRECFDTYVGGWREGKQHGYGRERWFDGLTYQGGWYDGQCHGHGVWIHIDGRSYESTWEHGVDVR